ncbi:hypothetical protein DH2020_046443 [Rehmannia glutinosa]|uniref:Uncharacterized protein n=1 Tax=Rehmannia glutinosa TaxID=99300 RepID=A0ABR0UBA3_REHGL
MSFADELFFNGLVMPLKLPPRLQYDTDSNSFSHKSPVSSPRTVCKIPFTRKNSWNDDFDPFMVALQKVREEKRGRNSHHRRSRSYSPFRALSKCSSSDCTNNENSPIEPMQVKAQGFSGPLDFKGSAYARWVRDQTREGLSPKSPKRFLFGQRVRPLRNDQDGPGQPKEKYVRKKSGDVEKQLSFKFKENGHSNGKRKMAVVEYKPSVALCLGYGVESPK